MVKKFCCGENVGVNTSMQVSQPEDKGASRQPSVNTMRIYDNKIDRNKYITFTLAFAAATPLLAGVNDLAWLSGCWAADGAETGSIEQWTAPAGGSILGINRTVENGKTTTFEYLRIIELDGHLILIASPSGQETARFTMTHQADRKVVFENPQHDFPQKIIYEMTSKNALLGRIEGTVNDAHRTVDFPMTRIKCEPGPSDA